MQPIKSLPYRPCVGVMLFNQKNQVFVGKRIDTKSEAWQMPQGGIDPGEPPETAVFRELAEEIGTKDAVILAESKGWYQYDLPATLVPHVWGGKYRGQEQKWFAMRFLGHDRDININTAKPEFLKWKWVAIDLLPDLIVPFKRQLYQDVIEEFRYVTC